MRKLAMPLPYARTLIVALGVLSFSTCPNVLAETPKPKTNLLNDVHSRLNPVTVAEVVKPTTSEEVTAAVLRAKKENLAISIAGARHSMGGQQFAAGALHLDMTSLNKVLSLDKEKGLVRAQAGITWPTLREALDKEQSADPEPWSITQKQTGADILTLGGAVSSNIHGRGLTWQPFVQDVETITLVNAEGEILKLSRTENTELFSLVIGGYGLFGVITEVEVRLRRRQKVERVVEVTTMEGLPERIEQRIRDGFLLGDFQFCPDEKSSLFLKEGVFSCYRPIADPTKVKTPLYTLNPEAWNKLLVKAHSDKTQAWADYKNYYLHTNGQTYSSDLAQFNHYNPDYEDMIEATLPSLAKGSLMISEVYVPREKLEDFMTANAVDFKANQTNAIYGTIRFIKKDAVSFLPWAREDYACIVVNLRVTHTPEGIEKAQGEFRRLIDRALERGGSFFLTYHRWATKEQMLKAYPQFPQFLELKKKYDPTERFQSEWCRHWKGIFAATP